MTTHFTKLENLSLEELKKLATKYSSINADIICKFESKKMLINMIVTSPTYMREFKGTDFMALMKFVTNLK